MYKSSDWSMIYKTNIGPATFCQEIKQVYFYCLVKNISNIPNYFWKVISKEGVKFKKKKMTSVPLN